MRPLGARIVVGQASRTSILVAATVLLAALRRFGTYSGDPVFWAVEGRAVLGGETVYRVVSQQQVTWYVLRDDGVYIEKHHLVNVSTTTSRYAEGRGFVSSTFTEAGGWSAEREYVAVRLPADDLDDAREDELTFGTIPNSGGFLLFTSTGGVYHSTCNFDTDAMMPSAGCRDRAIASYAHDPDGSVWTASEDGDLWRIVEDRVEEDSLPMPGGDPVPAVLEIIPGPEKYLVRTDRGHYRIPR